MFSGTIDDTLAPSIEINAPADGHNEVHDGSSLEDDLRSLHHQDIPVEVFKERRNRVDEIVDKIIDAFTVKTEDRFIDTDEGILSNEERT